MPMTVEQMQARIAELEKQVVNKSVTGRLKVSEKGGVSFYGLGRFPTTLYASQWKTLFANRERIEKFIAENESLLSHKESAKEQAVTA